MMGIQCPSNSAARWRAWGPLPPMRMGGYGFWTGLGNDQSLSKLTYLPWYSASSWVQIAFMAEIRSRRIFQRSPNGVPWSSISSAFHPPPMPKSTRPPEMKSRLATSLARMIGSRSITRQIPVPSMRVLVTAAAAPRATNGSSVCQ